MDRNKGACRGRHFDRSPFLLKISVEQQGSFKPCMATKAEMEQQTMDTNGMAPEATPNPVESPLVNADLPSFEQELGLNESGGIEQAGGQAQGQAFKFAGRDYANQSAAEKAVKQLYGQFADTKGLVNTIKKAMNNPEMLEALKDDPQWAPILEKLGIESATDEVRRQDRQQAGQPQSQEQIYREWQIERDIDRIEREEWRFEKQLGRSLTPEERRNTLQMIKQADTLTFDQAYFLGNKDRVLAQARQPAAPAGGAKPAGNRPAPPPVRGSQGGPVNGKKGVHQMGANEWKENLRNSEEFKEILSRRGS